MENYDEFIENEKQRWLINSEATTRLWVNQMFDTYVDMYANDVEDIDDEFANEFSWIEDIIGEYEYTTLADAFLYAVEFLFNRKITDPEPEIIYEVMKNFYNIIECVNYEARNWEKIMMRNECPSEFVPGRIKLTK